MNQVSNLVALKRLVSNAIPGDLPDCPNRRAHIAKAMEASIRSVGEMDPELVSLATILSARQRIASGEIDEGMDRKIDAVVDTVLPQVVPE